jgi:hypothetical protein
MRLPVHQGDEYATVVANAGPSPSANYTSVNFLYTSGALVGANARNERDRKATDAYYGLDPRELVGYTTDGGGSWALPGGPYGQPAGRNFLPTYIQQYSDGTVAGQPYYYTGDVAQNKTMAFGPVSAPWTIRGLGAFTPTPSRGTLVLTIDGTPRATAGVSGIGMLRAPVGPITVPAGHTVAVTARGIPVPNVIADTTWGELMGMNRPTWPWHLVDESDFSAAAPIYPLTSGPAPTSGTPNAQ